MLYYLYDVEFRYVSHSFLLMMESQASLNYRLITINHRLVRFANPFYCNWKNIVIMKLKICTIQHICTWN